MNDFFSGAMNRFVESRSSCLEFFRLSRVASLAAIGIAAAITSIFYSILSGPEKFPASSETPMRLGSPDLRAQMLPKAPKSPSVPGLTVYEPEIIPGLESVSWAKSPSMSADMLDIVYVGFNPEGTGDDVWIASRKSVDDPFAAPSPINSIKSKSNETHPSLSPDGLELSFLRLTDPTSWEIATRKNRAEAFSAPIIVQTGKWIQRPFQVDFAQQMSRQHGLLIAGDPDLTASKCYFYRRSGGNLTEVKEARISNAWPRLHCSGNGIRVYFGSAEGVYVSARANQASGFLMPQLLLNEAIVGGDASRFDSSIWFSPEEDVLVYACQDPQAHENNRLWQMRLR